MEGHIVIDMVRLKTRYLLVEATGARKLAVKKEDIVVLIRESIAKSYGDFGSGLAQYAFQGAVELSSLLVLFWLVATLTVYVCCCVVLYYNTHTRLAVIRCAREMCKMVETSLVFVTDVHNQDVSIRVARVCGMNSSTAAVACCFVAAHIMLTEIIGCVLAQVPVTRAESTY